MGFYTPLVLVIAALVWAFTRRSGQRHLGDHLQLPLRVHPGHADGDGGRAVRRRAPGHPDQERRRHRAGGQDQRLHLRQDGHAHDRGTGGQPPGAARRRHARRAAAHRGLRREIQQSSHGQGAGATGRGSRRAAGGTEGFCRDRGTRREGRGGRRQSAGGPGAVAARQRRAGGFPEVGGPERNRRLEPDLRRARRPVHRLGRSAGPDPRRGARVAGGTEGQRRAAHRDDFRRPPARGHPRGARRSAARKPRASACRRTRSSLCAPSRPRATWWRWWATA